MSRREYRTPRATPIRSGTTVARSAIDQPSGVFPDSWVSGTEQSSNSVCEAVTTTAPRTPSVSIEISQTAIGLSCELARCSAWLYLVTTESPGRAVESPPVRSERRHLGRFHHAWGPASGSSSSTHKVRSVIRSNAVNSRRITAQVPRHVIPSPSRRLVAPADLGHVGLRQNYPLQPWGS